MTVKCQSNLAASKHIRFTRMFNKLKGKDYRERMRNLSLWSLEERRKRQDLFETYKKSETHPKLEKMKRAIDIRKYLSHTVVGRWNALD